MFLHQPLQKEQNSKHQCEDREPYQNIQRRF